MKESVKANARNIKILVIHIMVLSDPGFRAPEGEFRILPPAEAIKVPNDEMDGEDLMREKLMVFKKDSSLIVYKCVHHA